TIKAMERQVLYFCPQHECCVCERKTQDAGGLLFRCGTCSNSYCEDCLPVDEDIVEIGEQLPAFEELNYGPINQAYYIKCPPCVKYAADLKAEMDAAAALENGGDQKEASAVELMDQALSGNEPATALDEIVKENLAS
ncbi:hypothetical protein HDU99_003626, partial [Rhizoclosmatium hyalinum]